jgi:hypothetical protein
VSTSSKEENVLLLLLCDRPMASWRSLDFYFKRWART